MPYFDSQKNRALWAKELQELRKEKEARKAGKGKAEKVTGAADEIQFDDSYRMQNNYRIKTSYRELLLEEQQSINERKAERQAQKQRERASEIETPNINMGRR